MSFCFNLFGQNSSVKEAVSIQGESHSSETSHSIGYLYLDVERIANDNFLDVKQVEFYIFFARSGNFK